LVATSASTLRLLMVSTSRCGEGISHIVQLDDLGWPWTPLRTISTFSSIPIHRHVCPLWVGTEGNVEPDHSQTTSVNKLNWYSQVLVPEWLSGMTRNHVGSARAGSNPAEHVQRGGNALWWVLFPSQLLFFFGMGTWFQLGILPLQAFYGRSPCIVWDWFSFIAGEALHVIVVFMELAMIWEISSNQRNPRKQPTFDIRFCWGDETCFFVEIK
jgi:hypothetical protein